MHRSRSRTASTALTALGAVGAVGVGAGIWGIGIERYLFTLRRHQLAVLPAGTPSLRVLHLSDAHMAPWQRRKQRFIAALADWQPDVIVNTGDNLGHVDGLRGVRAAFAPFVGVPGFFVHGSNDRAAPSPRNPFRYFAGPSRHDRRPEPLHTPALDSYLQDELGWLRLNNAAGSVLAGGVRVDAFGVNDPHAGWDRLELLPDAIAGLPDGAPAVSFGVSHAPYVRTLEALIGLGADVLFAGHTHGGQVRLPGFGALVANCDIPLRQARGLSEWSAPAARASGSEDRTVPLHVSAGLGHSIYAPVRFACRPEATLLTLTATDRR